MNPEGISLQGNTPSGGSSSEKKLLKHMVSAPEWPRGPPAGINPRTFILVWLWSSPLHQCLTSLTYTVNIPLSGYLYSPWLALRLKMLRSTGPDWVASPAPFYFRKSSSCLQSVNSQTRWAWFSTDSSRSSIPDRWATEHPFFLCKNIADLQKERKAWSASAIAGHLMPGAWRGPG